MIHQSQVTVSFDTTEQQQQVEAQIRDVLSPLGDAFIGYRVVSETLFRPDGDEVNLAIVIITTDPVSASAILCNEGYLF